MLCTCTTYRWHVCVWGIPGFYSGPPQSVSNCSAVIETKKKRVVRTPLDVDQICLVLGYCETLGIVLGRFGVFRTDGE